MPLTRLNIPALRDKLATGYVLNFYKRWFRKGWNDRQAADALRCVERDVRRLVDATRAQEILP